MNLNIKIIKAIFCLNCEKYLTDDGIIITVSNARDLLLKALNLESIKYGNF